MKTSEHQGATKTALQPKDVITWHPDGRVNFPTLGGCGFCPGLRRVVGHETGDFEADRELAFQVGLLQHGYYLGKWEGMNVANAAFFPTRCQCACPHPSDRIKHETPEAYLHISTCLDCGARGGGDSSD